MAGTAAFSYQMSDARKSVELSWLCTADGSGNVSSPTITGASGDFQWYTKFSGTIIRAEIAPGASAVQPSDLYDVELRPLSDSTIDFLGGLGDNCSQTTTRWGTPVDEVNGVAVQLVNDQLVPYAAACGASKQFTLKVLLALEE
jgi:hypothetical protein